MTKQIEITAPRPLMDASGRLSTEGWARRPYWTYDRRAVRAPGFRIKEWDYYYVLSDSMKRGITFTLSDLGYAGLMALCWLDFESGEARQADALVPFTRGRCFAGDTDHLCFENDDLALRFDVEDGARKLSFRSSVLDLSGELVLSDPPEADSLNIATSWAGNRRRFYYNRKIAGMPASGSIRVAGTELPFRPDESFGGLDWGRGAWTYRNRWFWSSAGGRIDGHLFAFNLGYGFSDRSSATENVLFRDGRAHKLGDVVFHYDPEDYLAPWSLQDNEGRLDLRFTPIVDRSSAVNLLLIRSVQHQVFGRFTGRALLDDGTPVLLDGLLGFAEDVLNRW